jgi:hypothetical protein
MLLVVWACGGGSDRRPPNGGSPADADASDGALVFDRDGDGLCDGTEAEFGTDPKQSDTDGDGIPDLVELGNGFDATDSTQPAADQIAHLLANPSSTLDFPVRVTIEGDGGGVSGHFADLGSFYSDGSSARDYFRDALAVSADPLDGVRRIDADAASFRSVLGRTRLEFNLRFVYAPADALPCTRAYPFGYNLESDSGDVVSEAMFLLVVSPESEQDASSMDYCLPTECQ